MIPKIIHYVWVGNSPKSELILKCIKSWEEKLPDYQIIEWNDESLQRIQNTYALQAYKEKKWAFVSDFLRIFALYHHGGIYLDTDVQVTKSLDQFLEHDFFMGSDDHDHNGSFPMTAVIGAKKHNLVIEGLLSKYNLLEFVLPDGELNQTPNPALFAQYFAEKYNLIPPYKKDLLIQFHKNCYIYPTYFFSKPKKNKVNFTIHFFDGSWLSGFSRRQKLKLGSYEITRFKRRNYFNDEVPFVKNEKILWKVRLSKKLFYALIKKP